MPPRSTDGTVPTSAATSPDSNAPSWFEVPVKSECTALTRPRIVSGVRIWTREARMTTLTTPDAPSQGVAGEKDRRRQRSGGGRRAQEPEAAGPCVEDVAGVDGQEGRGAAEQHREQVERHRAEQHALSQDEGNPRENALER